MMMRSKNMQKEGVNRINEKKHESPSPHTINTIRYKIRHKHSKRREKRDSLSGKGGAPGIPVGVTPGWYAVRRAIVGAEVALAVICDRGIAVGF